MEIRCPRRQPAEDRALQFADIGALPGDQRASRVGDLERPPGERPRRAPESEDRESANVQGWGLFLPASATPMFSCALTEWFPMFGASWQVPQEPAMLGWFSASFNPATPVMLIVVVLKSSSPRAIAWRRSFVRPVPR